MTHFPRLHKAGIFLTFVHVNEVKKSNQFQKKAIILKAIIGFSFDFSARKAKGTISLIIMY